MRRAAAIDKNQPAIVEALRRCGAHVTITSQLKNAFDLIVVYKGTAYICEIKDGTLNPSARKLTEGELECKTSIERAGGTYHVITSINDALTMIGEIIPGIKLKDYKNKQPCTLQSVIQWLAVAEKLPELDTEVLVVTKDGWVGYGQRSEKLILERGDDMIYRQTNKKQIEWGISENDGEYWHKLENIILWAAFPEPPCV